MMLNQMKWIMVGTVASCFAAMWLLLREGELEDTVSRRTTTLDSHREGVASSMPRAPAARRVEEARWRERLAKVRLVHSAAGTSPPPIDRGRNVDVHFLEPSTPQPYGCAQDDCIQRLAAEVEGIVESCRSLLIAPASTAVVQAILVGAADIGVVAESIELKSENSEGEFEACMQEALYGLYMDPTGDDFRQMITVSLGGTLSMQAGDGVSDEARAAVEEVLARQGADDTAKGNGSPQIIMLHSPSAEEAVGSEG